MKKTFAILLAIVFVISGTFSVTASATAQPQQTSGEALVLTVKDETNRFIYQSYDGGKTWAHNSKPLVYISIKNAVLPEIDAKVTYTVHSNTQQEISYGRRFALQKWNGQKWVEDPRFDEMEIELDAAILAPKTSRPDVASWGSSGIEVGTGKFKLVKKIAAENRQFTCEAEFIITGNLPALTVKDETNRFIYQSNDGGKTWAHNSKPLMHISIDKTVFSKEDGQIPYTVYNNTNSEQYSDVYFSLQKRDGQKWVKCPETDELAFIDIALVLAPDSSSTLSASWGNSGIKLEAGQYKLIKKLSAENRKFTCEVVFSLE